MNRSRKELIAAHSILLLAGLLLLAIGAQIDDGSWRDSIMAIGTTLVATPIVVFLLRYFSGDPIDDLKEVLASLSMIAEDATMTGLAEIKAERSALPTSSFVEAAQDSSQRIWILTYAAEFLADDPRFLGLLGAKSRAGCDVRLLLGDPTGDAILKRDAEEATEGSIPSRIETMLKRSRYELGDQFGTCVRLFDAPLYASLYRFDISMIVCPALFGQRGSKAPAFRVHQGRPLFTAYETHFIDVWDAATPVN